MRLPHRIAGNLALDFANTIDWRDTAREHDHLMAREGLVAWARAAGLDGAGDASMAEAIALRGAIDAIGWSFATDQQAPEEACRHLRDAAAASLSRACLTGRPLQSTFGGGDALLGPIAWSAMTLFESEEVARIKACPFHDCRWLFVDRSKNGSRRWCEMGTCGNRAKKQSMTAG